MHLDMNRSLSWARDSLSLLLLPARSRAFGNGTWTQEPAAPQRAAALCERGLSQLLAVTGSVM